jgi:hypothetical protein
MPVSKGLLAVVKTVPLAVFRVRKLDQKPRRHGALRTPTCEMKSIQCRGIV